MYNSLTGGGDRIYWGHLIVISLPPDVAMKNSLCTTAPRTTERDGGRPAAFVGSEVEKQP